MMTQNIQIDKIIEKETLCTFQMLPFQMENLSVHCKKVLLRKAVFVSNEWLASFSYIRL